MSREITEHLPNKDHTPLLMRRNLTYFWRIHIAVLLGVAVATTVLTGALLVGDSVRGSLRDLTLDRLGQIDHALVSERFFREELAADLSNTPAFETQFQNAVPAILLNGTAINPNTKSRASRIQIQGIDQRFAVLWEDTPATNDLNRFLTKQRDQVFPSIIINESLQRELNIAIGEPILISFERQSNIHREFLLGRRDHSDVVQTLRLTVTKIIPDRGIGRFGLRSHQSLPLNAYVSISVLQKSLAQQEKVNAILVAEKNRKPKGNGETQKSENGRALQNILYQVLRLEDLGLILRPNHDYLSLESTQFILKPNIIEAAEAVATEHHASFLPIMTYLANAITANERKIPYSTITAIETQRVALKLTDGGPAPSLADNEILLNEWAAEDLGVNVGRRIDVTYYVVGPREALLTRHAQFRLKGILTLDGLAVDPSLTPDFPGIHDADDMAKWEPPFPIDLHQVRSKDEAYWDEFGGAPKAFVSEKTGQQLWSSRFGDLTSIRIGALSGADVKAAKANFQKGLREKIRPEQVGFVFQPVKVQGFEAASGATNFSMLFIGFSLFLIVSAALLVGLLFRLGVEQRVSEIGILLALGYPIAAVRRRFMKEAGLLAAIGGVIGLGGAAIYAWLLMVGLKTWWLAAVGTPFLSLHISPLSLVFGYLTTIVVVLISIRWVVWRFGKMPVRALITGVTAIAQKVSSSAKATGRKRLFAFAGLGLAAALILFALVSSTTSSVRLFFGSGALSLISGLIFFSLWLHSGKGFGFATPVNSPPVNRASKTFLRGGTVRMGTQNSARHPGRSLLCVALVACACFVIVAVGANRHTELQHGISLEKESGTGGFTWEAESDIPLHHDLNSEAGRFELGFSDSDAAIPDGTQIFPFRVLPGEDVSCLNLYQPQKPRILGVPDDLIRRGGFQFQQKTTTEDNPWWVLAGEIEPGVIPAVGDYNSVLWVLHLKLGKDLIIQNELGQEVKLRLVGLLQSSIFQSELLISEANFKKHFPSQSGYSYFLIQSPLVHNQESRQISQILENTLSDYGFDVSSTTEKLANYRAVENTYLSTFQMLGGLGLILGTLGLGIVLLRNVIERRGELATLRAFGFRRSTLSMMLWAENGLLLLIGILIGSFSALIAVAPRLITPGTHAPWLSLLITLIFVFLIGTIASGVAVFFALRSPLLPALKGE